MAIVDQKTGLGPAASLVAVPCGDGYHCAHATYLASHRPADGAQPHRRHHHPSRPSCNSGWTNRLDTLSDRHPNNSCLPRPDRMDLDCHGLRHLWNRRIGIRPLHPREHLGRTERDPPPTPRQRNERDDELFTSPVWWAGVFTRVVGARASRIPSSQSSIPFFIRTILIDSNPASISQVFVSTAE